MWLGGTYRAIAANESAAVHSAKNARRAFGVSAGAAASGGNASPLLSARAVNGKQTTKLTRLAIRGAAALAAAPTTRQGLGPRHGPRSTVPRAHQIAAPDE